MTAWNAQHARLATGHAGDDEGTTGQNIDVAGKLARVMSDDGLGGIRRILDFDVAGFDDEQIEIGLASLEHDLAIRVIAGRSHGFDLLDFRGGQTGKRSFFCGCHSAILNETTSLPE